MGWYSDTVNFLTADGGKAEGFFNSDIVSGALQGAAASGVNKFFQPDIPKVGYQGKIPDLQAVRERVPMQQPTEGQPARRPGSAGRRYFSDTQFAERPDTSTLTVEEARARAQAQAQQLAQAQAQAPASQQQQPQHSGGPSQTVGMASGSGSGLTTTTTTLRWPLTNCRYGRRWHCLCT